MACILDILEHPSGAHILDQTLSNDAVICSLPLWSLLRMREVSKLAREAVGGAALAPSRPIIARYVQHVLATAPPSADLPDPAHAAVAHVVASQADSHCKTLACLALLVQWPDSLRPRRVAPRMARGRASTSSRCRR